MIHVHTAAIYLITAARSLWGGETTLKLSQVARKNGAHRVCVFVSNPGYLLPQKFLPMLPLFMRATSWCVSYARYTYP